MALAAVCVCLACTAVLPAAAALLLALQPLPLHSTSASASPCHAPAQYPTAFSPGGHGGRLVHQPLHRLAERHIPAPRTPHHQSRPPGCDLRTFCRLLRQSAGGELLALLWCCSTAVPASAAVLLLLLLLAGTCSVLLLPCAPGCRCLRQYSCSTSYEYGLRLE